MTGTNQNGLRTPPTPSTNLFLDFKHFLWHTPVKDTQIKFTTAAERDYYNQLVQQRIGIDTSKFSILNFHKIGIDAPASFVFNELLHWNGDCLFWPNHIARVDRIENDLKNIRILPFGWKKYPPGMKSFFGMKLIPLFLLNAIRFKKTPDNDNFDNARYLLYECSGGYPIGFFTMYVRSSIPSMGEVTTSQLIVGVGFNFYGNDKWHESRKLINILWEKVHNRVTANVLLRLKQLSEWNLCQVEDNKMELVALPPDWLDEEVENSPKP